MRVSVLDLGSNSFRLLVADVDQTGAIRPVLRERELLRLGGDVADRGAISPAAADRAVAAVQHLTDLAMRTGTDQSLVVATSAIRDAANREDIVGRLSVAAGSPVRVLSGAQEATLGFLGVAASIALPEGPHLVLDLGGGSLELTVGQNLEVTWSASVDIGVSRLHAECVTNDPPTQADIDCLETRVSGALEPLADTVKSLSPAVTVLIGGPHRSIAQLIGARTLGWEPLTLNQLTVRADEIHALRAELLTSDIGSRAKIDGMKESRVSEITTAAVIVSHTLTLIGVDEASISYWGLREGAILDAFGITDLPLGVDLRPASVHQLHRRFLRYPEHDAKVGELALSLFDQLADTQGLDRSARELLRYAAKLHTVGMSVAFKGFHRHGAYLIEHSELRGFDPHEVAILASLVRFQRSGVPKRNYQPFVSLGSGDQETVTKLAPLLLLADTLDRGLDQSVDSVQVSSKERTLQAVVTGTDVELRQEWAEAAIVAFATAYDADLEFVGATLMDVQNS